MRLPDRRAHTTFELVHDHQVYFVGVGHAPPSAIAGYEVFVQPEKTSSALEALARDAAIAISMSLQHGVATATLCAAVTRDDSGRPASVIGAVIDALAKDFPTPPAEIAP